MSDPSRIVIIGTGLLGASVGLAYRAANPGADVVGLGRNQSTLDEAKRVGAITHGETDFGKALDGANLAIIAVPLGAFDAVFEQLAAHNHAGLVITDVGSTKVSVHAAARAHLPDASVFVGSHPMAGSEHSGPGAATADLLAGKPCIVTAADDANADAVATVEAFWRALAMPVVRMSPVEHDEQTAAISHLPHLASVLLVQVAKQLGGWDIASTGFAGATRLASSNPPMRRDIIAANREAILTALGVCRDQLDRAQAIIESNDDDALLSLLEDSQQRRDAWKNNA